MSARLDLLELLADRLESEKRIPFFYGMYAGPRWLGDPNLSCGASACAAGLATTMPEFRALGLKLVKVSHPGLATVEAPSGESGAAAMAEVLGLELDEAVFLFYPHIKFIMGVSPDSDATATEVAAHIRAFVARKRAELAVDASTQNPDCTRCWGDRVVCDGCLLRGVDCTCHTANYTPTPCPDCCAEVTDANVLDVLIGQRRTIDEEGERR